MFKLDFFTLPFECLLSSTIFERRHSHLSIEEYKYQQEKEKLKKTKQKSARAYLLQKEQDAIGKKLIGDKAEREYKRQMMFCKCLEKHRKKN
jgi:hypothetical protein